MKKRLYGVIMMVVGWAAGVQAAVVVSSDGAWSSTGVIGSSNGGDSVIMADLHSM